MRWTGGGFTKRNERKEIWRFVAIYAGDPGRRGLSLCGDVAFMDHHEVMNEKKGGKRMKKEKSPLDKLEEIEMVSQVINLFFDESGDPEQARKQMQPFVVWLLDKSLEALSALETMLKMMDNAEKLMKKEEGIEEEEEES